MENSLVGRGNSEVADPAVLEAGLRS